MTREQDRFGSGAFGASRFDGGAPELVTADQPSAFALDLTLGGEIATNDAVVNIAHYRIESTGSGVPVFVTAAELLEGGLIELAITEPTEAEDYSIEVVGDVLFDDGSSARGMGATFPGVADRPIVVSVATTGPSSVCVTFSEPMRANADLLDPDQYTMTGPSTLTPRSVTVVSPNQIVITFHEVMAEGEKYTLEVG